MNVELIIDAKATLGEGAIWDSRRKRLYWVDILEGRVHVYNPADETDQTIEVGQRVGTVVSRGGGLMLAVHHGFASLDLETNELTIIGDPEKDLPDNCFNDGKCDPAGRFWAGTVSIDSEPGAGSLYCMDTDHSVRRMFGGVTCSNGIVWSLDCSTMYYIDTPTRQVDAFDYNVETGEITNRRVAVTVPEQMGKPDGMTIDAEGMLWVAMWEGSSVARWDPRDGSPLQTIPIPALRVTSCAFGGENLDELYVTTARIRMTETQLAEQPHAGGVFRVRPGVRGIKAHEFGGEISTNESEKTNEPQNAH